MSNMKILSAIILAILMASCNNQDAKKTDAVANENSGVTLNKQTEPLGGKPAPGSKPSVADLDYQVKYQRAFEAVLWSMPAVAIYSFTHATKGVGGANNTILAYSKPAEANLEALTANNVTPYITALTDLSNGPVVLEIPAETDKAILYGQIVDHWQLSIADVGPSGVDKGKGDDRPVYPVISCPVGQNSH